MRRPTASGRETPTDRSRMGEGRPGQGQAYLSLGQPDGRTDARQFPVAPVSQGPCRDQPEQLLLYPPIISVDKCMTIPSARMGCFRWPERGRMGYSWYDPKYYSGRQTRTPKVPKPAASAAFAGAGGSIARQCPCRKLNGTDPNTKMNWMGFRCAQDANEVRRRRRRRNSGRCPLAIPAQRRSNDFVSGGEPGAGAVIVSGGQISVNIDHGRAVACSVNTNAFLALSSWTCSLVSLYQNSHFFRVRFEIHRQAVAAIRSLAVGPIEHTTMCRQIVLN